MIQPTFFPQADPLRTEIFRGLVAANGGSMAPMPAPEAFAFVVGRRVLSPALSHRRKRDALPWPRSAEIKDGARIVVPLHVIVDVLLQHRADAPRKPRGRPRKSATTPTLSAAPAREASHG